MPLKKTSYAKKRVYRSRRSVRGRAPARRGALTRAPMNHATISETLQLDPLGGGVFTQYNGVNLSQFARATSVAESFQVYRVKYLEFTIRPQFDTFPQGAPSQIPALYKMIDRNGSISSSGNLAMLRNMGCKAIRLDDKQIVVRYKPGVILATGSGLTSVNTKPLISPWLSTDANAGIGSWAVSRVPHFGLTCFVDAFQCGASIEVTAVIEFAKPNWNVGQ